MRILRFVTFAGTALLVVISCVSCGGGGQKTPTTNELTDMIETATQEQIKDKYGYPTAVLYESADVVVWVYQEGGETVRADDYRFHTGSAPCFMYGLWFSPEGVLDKWEKRSCADAPDPAAVFELGYAPIGSK
jgi:hypothetical protein